MPRMLLRLAAPLISLFLMAGSLYLGRERLGLLPRPALFGHVEHGGKEPPKEPVNESTATPAAEGALASENITTYLDAILDGGPTQLPGIECPAINETRYAPLQAAGPDSPSLRYFVALDLRQCLPLLPRLVGSIVEAVRFLGPQHCALSIIEGNSADGTADVLAALRPGLEALGTRYFLRSSSIDPSAGHRIEGLAELRNMALEPLLHDLVDRARNETTIIFLNDVAACPEDILELALQRKNLGGDMTCAMDWTYVGRDPTFYDVWVARGINGDTYFHIPPDGNWDSAWNLFWNAEETRSRFHAQRPFQVFSCWNGATAFSAEPVLGNLRFRAANTEDGECFQGEPQLFCKDMWFRGYRKIAVVPTVNLEYSIEKGKRIKEAKGFVSDLVSNQDSGGDRIEWQLEPPDEVRCMPNWGTQSWRLWNETLS